MRRKSHRTDIALKCHNSAQSWPFESKLGCPRASGRCSRRWYHPPAQTHKAGRRRARYIRRTSHRTYPDTSVNQPYLTLTEADSDALWSSVTTGPRRFISSTTWPIHILLTIIIPDACPHAKMHVGMHFSKTSKTDFPTSSEHSAVVSHHVRARRKKLGLNDLD